MKRTRINLIGKKKAAQIKEEKVVRQQLMARCNGRCEECGGDGYPFGLHPHEKVFRSHGGKMSMENSIILCNTCHGHRHNLKIVGGI